MIFKTNYKIQFLFNDNNSAFKLTKIPRVLIACMQVSTIITVHQSMVLSPCTHWGSSRDRVCIVTILVIKTNSLLPDVHPFYFLTGGGKSQQVEWFRSRELYFFFEWTITSKEDTPYYGF